MKQYLLGNNVNIRGGPSTYFKSYGKLKKDTKVQVIGKISNFNMIVTSDNTVGMIREDFLKKVTTTNNTNNTNKNNENASNSNNSSNLTGTTGILNMINEYRKKENLAPYVLDKSLTNIAELKANDMAKNNYFSHTSKTYGTPFEMMQGFGINYKSAGENIAGNSSLKDAISSFIASPTHKKNLLSNKFTNIGIGMAKDKTYGYILVLMFIQKQ